MKRFENKEIKDVLTRDVVAIANVEGQQGWELTAVLQSVESVHEAHLYFKRKLTPDQPTPEQIRTVRGRTASSMQLARAALVATDCDVDAAVCYVNNVGYS